MSIRRHPILWCDGIEDDTAPTGVRHAESTLSPAGLAAGDFCPHWWGDGETGLELRRGATRVGWRRIDGRDYSPQCARLLESSRSVPAGQEASE